jgi:hypothetical protein
MPEDFYFELEPDDHRYTLNGAEVPATTRVLSLARNSLAGVPKKVLEKARERGIEVHRAIELYMKDDLDRRTLRLETKFRFERFLRFIDFHKVEPISLPTANYVPTFFGGVLCEVPLVHPLWKFGVTPDIGLCVIDSALTLVEIKATSLHSDATALQTASQEHTINHFFEKHGYKVERRCSVRLTSDDKPDVRWYKDPTDWPTFLSFLNASNWRKVHKIDAKEEANFHRY